MFWIITDTELLYKPVTNLNVFGFKIYISSRDFLLINSKQFILKEKADFRKEYFISVRKRISKIKDKEKIRSIRRFKCTSPALNLNSYKRSEYSVSNIINIHRLSTTSKVYQDYITSELKDRNNAQVKCLQFEDKGSIQETRKDQRREYHRSETQKCEFSTYSK